MARRERGLGSRAAALLVLAAAPGCGRIDYDLAETRDDAGERVDAAALDAAPLDGGEPDAGIGDGSTDSGPDASTVCLPPQFGAPRIDDFDRADGPLAAPWVGTTDVFRTDANQLVADRAGTIVWSGRTLGADQLAYVTLVDASSYLALTLKKAGAGDDLAQPFFLFEWDPTTPPAHVHIYYTDGTDVIELARLDTTFEAGDVLGAVARSDGVLELRRNDEVLVTANGSAYPIAAEAGYVGLRTFGPVRLDDLGAGELPAICR